MQTTPVTPVTSTFPTSGDATNDKPRTRIGSDFVSLSNIPLKTRVLAALGNERARIALAALRGEAGKLETLHNKAKVKFETASTKLVRKKEDAAAAVAREKKLGNYDRSEALSYESQKYQNENATRHGAALDALRIAQRKVADQSKAVDKYSNRMTLAFQSLRNLGHREASSG